VGGTKPTAVFDTGILLQATISATGPAARALNLFDQEEISIFVSRELLKEMRRVLTLPVIRLKNSRYSDSDIDALLDRLETKGIVIADIPSHFQCEGDPEDDHVINLAIEARAQYIVTRDKDLLDLMTNSEFTSRYMDITVLDPSAFLKQLGRER
jgi:putative PIN family toxin of toxin-antitoxin system